MFLELRLAAVHCALSFLLSEALSSPVRCTGKIMKMFAFPLSIFASAGATGVSFLEIRAFSAPASKHVASGANFE